jgi:hypothetical protein
MPFQVTNPVRGPSIVRAVDAGSYTITLNDLRGNPTTETVTTADIRRVMWSSNGYITITRNSVPILNLSGSGDMRLDEIGAIANNSNQSIAITIVTGGSIVMEVSKSTSYNVSPDTGFTV